MVTKANLVRYLKSAIKKHQVPGASFAVIKNGKLIRSAQAGVVNINTKVPVTPEAVFQIGSITKPITATLIMQLVDEGLLDIDEPIQRYLPEFQVLRDDVSQSVTCREFLSHTSGIAGDFFVDSGRGDEAMKRFLDKCTAVPSIFERGEMMSYCNLGFAVMGRLIEVLRRAPYDQVLDDYLFKPLGMDNAFAGPEQAIRFNCAIGHVPSQSKPGVWYASKIPYLSMGQAAAGAVPTMSAGDLLKFAQLHLDGGATPKGQVVLKRKSVRAMQSRQVRLPKYTRGGVDAWGLGWFLMNWDGHRLYGHDGATLGQYAFLRVLPKKQTAWALLTNGGDATGLFNDVIANVMKPIIGMDQPARPESSVQVKGENYLGAFDSGLGTRVELTSNKGDVLFQQYEGDSRLKRFKKPVQVFFIDRNTARLVTGNVMDDRTTLFFSRPDKDGRMGYVQFGFRQLVRDLGT